MEQIIQGEVNPPRKLKLQHQQVGTCASRADLSVHTTGVCLAEIEQSHSQALRGTYVPLSVQLRQSDRCFTPWMQAQEGVSFYPVVFKEYSCF